MFRARLFVSKSPSSERDVKAKSSDKVLRPSRGNQRRARVNELTQEYERDLARRRQRQRAAFLATHLGERNYDVDRDPLLDRWSAVEPAATRLNERDGDEDRGPSRERPDLTHTRALLGNATFGTSDPRDMDPSQDGVPRDYTLSDVLDRARLGSLPYPHVLVEVSYLPAPLWETRSTEV